MKNTSNIYEDFILEQQGLLKDINAKYLKVTDAIMHLCSLMGSPIIKWYSSKVLLKRVIDIANSLPNNAGVLYTTTDIATIKSLNEVKASSTLIQSYVTALMCLIKERDKLYNTKVSVELFASIPRLIFMYILKSYNKSNQSELLKGHTINLGFSTGFISIIKKKRNIKIEGDTIKGVNWGDSLKELMILAKEQEVQGLHTLYTDYVNKDITRNELILKMKPFTYKKYCDSKLPKWVVNRTNDYMPFLHWSKGTAKNMYGYSLTPCNYIHTDRDTTQNLGRSQDEVVKNAKSIDDIIDNEYIGLRDKLMMLCRYDSNYINTFDNGIQNSQ